MRRTLIFTATIAALLALTSQASAAVMINEIESDASGGAADWAERMNPAAAPVDVGGYLLKDSDDGHALTIPAPTLIPAGGYLSADVDVPGGFGLSKADAVRLYSPANALLDHYEWTDHATTTYGRCPDGTGTLAVTGSPTKGAANDCPVAGSSWPGAAAISLGDDTSGFGQNLSGLYYQPSGTSARGVLYAVQNGPSKLWRLIYDGAKWTPDTANGWATGKQLVYPNGGGVPDGEGVTVVDGAADVSTERNAAGPNSNTSRPEVLRYDLSSPAATLTATKEFNLTPDLPGLDKNAGLEAVAWLPDSLLVGKGFVDESTGLAYNPANYADHGAGLFFVGVEQTGKVVAYALNQSTGAYTRIAT